MKKLITLSVGLMLCAGASSAQKITMLEGGAMAGGYMPLCISANGKYVAGSTFAYPFFISEWQTQNNLIFLEAQGSVYAEWGGEIEAINNSGIGVGFDDNGSVMASLNNGGTYRVINLGLADDITEDGTIVCGLEYEPVNGDTKRVGYHAAILENGRVKALLEPTDEEVGFHVWGTRATMISQDGSTIVGFIKDDLETRPMIIWNRQADGSYVCNPVCKKYYSNTLDGENPYQRFKPMSINPDASLVVMFLTELDHVGNFHNLLGLYDVKNDQLTPIEIDGLHGIPNGTSFDLRSHSVTTDGTFVGTFIDALGSQLSFIKFADQEQPVELSLAFEDVEEFVYFNDRGINMIAGISGDGRYMVGFSTEDYGNSIIYAGYVFDRGDDAGVEGVTVEKEGVDEYYTIDGLRVNNPDKGLFIVKKADGTTTKILK